MAMKKHCCEKMSLEASRTCKDHEDPFTCPDCIIFYSSKFDEYGIIIHDGGMASFSIQFCPWCGTALPSSKRSVWLETLSDLGYDDPWNQDIPEEFRSNLWYKNR
jgi:hypothetical protein